MPEVVAERRLRDAGMLLSYKETHRKKTHPVLQVAISLPVLLPPVGGSDCVSFPIWQIQLCGYYCYFNFNLCCKFNVT